MKVCTKCGQLTDRYYTSRNTKCIDCQIPKNPTQQKTPEWMKPIIRQGRYETIKFIKSKPIDKTSINRLLGCNHNKIRKHIESQFQIGMSWDNHGSWHIDHIKPLSTAKTEKDLMMRFRWQNLRPLWKEANLHKKNGSISDEQLNQINNQMADSYRKYLEYETIRAKKNPNQLPIGQDKELSGGR